MKIDPSNKKFVLQNSLKHLKHPQNKACIRNLILTNLLQLRSTFIIQIIA